MRQRQLCIDEMHVHVFVPVGLPHPAYQAVLRCLKSRRFHTRLRNAVHAVIAGYPSLRSVAVAWSR